jgi:pimeloyl-ACP methyl ester carboxylesterase
MLSRKGIIILSVLVGFGLLLLVGPFLIPVPPIEGQAPRSLAGPTSRFIEVDGIEIHYEESGSGEPVFLLLHGFASSTFTWREVAGPLAQAGRVIAYDRPASGLTERPMEWDGPNPYANVYQPELARKLMDALGVKRAIVVGNSAGGTVAVQLALADADRVDALVLASPAIYSGGPPGWIRPLLTTPQLNHLGPLLARGLEARGMELIAMAWHNPDQVPPEVYEGYRIPLHVENWDRALWELTRASEPLGLEQRLDELDLPVLVITGVDDRIVPPVDSRQVAGSVRGARMVEIENCGHLPQEECPNVFLNEMFAFLTDAGIIP